MNEDRQPVTVDELALSTMIEQEALVRLLVRQGADHPRGAAAESRRGAR